MGKSQLNEFSALVSQPDRNNQHEGPRAPTGTEGLLHLRPPTPTDSKLLQRFHAKHTTGQGCWEWMGYKDNHGYGCMWFQGHTERAARVAAMFYLGLDLNSKLFACHHCDNPGCVNPQHLFIGTAKDNSDDAKRKGRLVVQKGESCHYHKLTEEEVLIARTLHRQGWKIADLARVANVTPCCVSLAVRGLTWKHLAVGRPTPPMPTENFGS